MTGRPDAKNTGSSPFSPSPAPRSSTPVAAPNPPNVVPGQHAEPAPSNPRLLASLSASRSSLRPERERHGLSIASQARQQAQRQSVARVSALNSSTPPPPPPPAAAQLEAAEQPQSRSNPEPQRESQDQPPRPLPPFAPLFALLTSTSHPTNRQTTHHPTVRYIFADDDPEVLTDALAHHHTGATGDDADVDNTLADRAVVLDVVPTADRAGFEVACASSLSPDWAVVSARLSRMPGGGAGVSSLDSAGGEEAGSSGDGAGTGGNPRSSSPGTTVLQIEGVSVESVSLGLSPTKMGALPEGEMQSSGASGMARQAQAGAGTGGSAASAAAEEYAGLVEDFEKRMGLLRRVVEAGQVRQRMVAREMEEQGPAEGVYKQDAPPARGIRDETAPGGEREAAEGKGE